MNRVPDSELVLVPGGSLITATPDEGRSLAFTLARHSIHNIQPDLDALKAGRPTYSVNPDSLIAAGVRSVGRARRAPLRPAPRSAHPRLPWPEQEHDH